MHDALASAPLTALSVSFSSSTTEKKCANLQPDPREGRSQEPAFGAFTNHIHHQSWIEARLERERSLTKHRLCKINASRLLLVQVSLREASDLN